MSRTDWAVQAGRYRAQLVATGEIGDRLRSLLTDLQTQPASGRLGRIEVAANPSGGYIIRSDDRVWSDAVAEEDVADEVVRMLLQTALDEEPSLVHIHAGAVTLGDRTAIVAGWAGSGKSSAIASLVAAGLSYVTDERLVVSPDGRSISGFPKPISLITGSFDAFAHLDPQRTGHGASNGTTWQIPASTLGPVATQEFRQPTVLVFITHRPDAALRLASVHPVDVAAMLFGGSPDVTARGHDGAAAIVSLASSIPGVELEYSDSDEMVAAIRGLLDDPPTTTGGDLIAVEGTNVTDRMPPTSANAIDTTASYAVVDSVSAWTVDDRAIAFLRLPGHAVGFDATITAWLQLLDGLHSLDALIDEVAAATEADVAVVRRAAQHVIHQLWAAGVIGPTDAALAASTEASPSMD